MKKILAVVFSLALAFLAEASQIYYPTPLHTAVKNEDFNMAKLLIENGEDVNPFLHQGYYQSPLHTAAENGYFEIAKLLIENGADVHALSYRGKDFWGKDLFESPLHTAAKNGSFEIAKLLIENGADVHALSYRGKDLFERPLHIAADNGYFEIAKLLIENGADVNAFDHRGEDLFESPLHVAADNGHFEIAKLLIENGADVHALSHWGETPLHEAAASKHNQDLKLAKLLIENGADVNSKTRKCRAVPLHGAIRSGAPVQMAKFLIENGADVDVVDDCYGNTPFLKAIKYGFPDLELQELLIKNGADINRASPIFDDYKMVTPLHMMVYEGYVKDVAWLLENGADVNIKDNKGRTPFDYIYLNRYRRDRERAGEIAKLLRIAAGAPSNSMALASIDKSIDGQNSIALASIDQSIDGQRDRAPLFPLKEIHFGDEALAHDNQHVRKWLAHFSTGSGKEIMRRILERSGRYIDLMKDIFRQQGIPQDLVYMSMVESGFYTHATSRANAVGYWQFLRPTGHHYGLRIDSEVDDRLDFALSTQAAGRYLKDMHNIFQDWLLSMAAYNCGPNCVLKAINKHNSSNFWDLSEKRALPAETRNYAPKVIAMKIIASDPSSYGFSNLDSQEPLEYSFISISQTASLRDIAESFNVSYRDLKRLNSRFISGIVPVYGEAIHIRAPADAVAAIETIDAIDAMDATGGAIDAQ